MAGINTNTAALMAKTYGQKANQRMLEPMKRLSSGLRINSASDDAAGMAVGNKMLTFMRSYEMGVRNSVDMIGLLTVAEGALSEITDVELRARELAIQAANGSYTDADRDKMEHEIRDLLTELDRIAAHTRYNDVTIFDGSFQNKIVQTGKGLGDHVQVDIFKFDTCELGRFWESNTFENGDFEQGSSVTQIADDVYQITGWEIHNKRIELGEEAQGDEPAADSPSTVINRDGDEVDNLIGGWAIPRDPTPRPYKNAIYVLVNPSVADTTNDDALTYNTTYEDIVDAAPPDPSDPGIFNVTIGEMESVSISGSTTTGNTGIMGQTYRATADPSAAGGDPAIVDVTIGRMTVTPTGAGTTSNVALMDQTFDSTVGDAEFRVTVGEMTFTAPGATTGNTDIMNQNLSVSAAPIVGVTSAQFDVTIGPMTVTPDATTTTTDKASMLGQTFTNVSGTGPDADKAKFTVEIGELTYTLTTTTTADGERFGYTYRNVTASGPSAGGTAAVFDISIDSFGNVSATVVTSGSGYADGETITIAGELIDGLDDGSDDLSLTVNEADISVTLTSPGSGYTAGDTITISGALIGGSDGVDDVEVTVNSANISVTTTDPGSGYTAGDTVKILGSSLGGVDGVDDITLTVGDANITVNVLDGGSAGYADGDVITVPIGDSGETIDVEVNTANMSVSLVDPGSGYKVGELIRISGTEFGPNGADVADEIYVVGNDPTVVVEATSGSGYTVGDTVTLAAGAITTDSDALPTEVVKVPPGTDDSSRPSDFGDIGDDSETGFRVENGVMILDTGTLNSVYGWDIAHGPYIISSEAKTIKAGEKVFFDWKASGTNDAFDIFAYLLNVDTGETQIMLDQTQELAGETDWETVETVVEADGNYKYIFINGTYDATGGKVLGAEMYIDNIYINRPRLPAEHQHTLCDISLQSVDEANNAVSVLDLAISQTSSERARYGALINRLRQSLEMSSAMNSSLGLARSRVFDAEYTIESSRLAKYQILAKASLAMLAQANRGDRSLLKLLN